jgi:hypothetical protein
MTNEFRQISIRHHEYEAVGRTAHRANDYGPEIDQTGVIRFSHGALDSKLFLEYLHMPGLVDAVHSRTLQRALQTVGTKERLAMALGCRAGG